MIELEGHIFEPKFAEMNIRQRMYEGKSMVTLQVTTEFFPSFLDRSIVSGMIEVKVDTDTVHSLADLEEKSLKGNIGVLTFSVQKDGIWEHKTIEDFSITFGKKEGRHIPVLVESGKDKIEVTATMISLYTTSTNIETLEKNFTMTDFYENSLSKKVGNSQITKYFVKE